MFPAAFRHLAFSAALLLASSSMRAADAPARAAPTRPGSAAPAQAAASSAPASAVPLKKIGVADYVNLTDAATRLGLKFSWVKRGRIALLSGPGARAEIEADSRETTINGLRVFLGDKAEDAGGQVYVSRIDFERCLTPLLRPGTGVTTPPPPKTIVLDPGHGGNDPGKINDKLKINEKTFTLDVAQRVRKLLEAAGWRVVLTRDDDIALDSDKQADLAKRAALANQQRADLFVSIHFNAIANDTKTSGVEVYNFAPTNQHAAEWWSTMSKNDPHLEKTDQPVNRFDHWSVALGQSIQRRFVSDLKTFDRGKKLMHLGVLRPLNCPGVLVECGFLTSDVEARKISTAVYRQQIAQALAAGIRDYAALVAPSSSRVATTAK
jgi:N-acetylmuramoyl-L-alanine amidase